MKTLRVSVPAADMHGEPDASALRGKQESQLVYGETFTVEEEKDGWCRGFSTHDGYKGYIRKEHLADLPAPSHVITAARAHVYTDATIKSPFLHTLSYGSLVAVAETGEKFSRLSSGGWIYSAQLSPVGRYETDIASAAKKFLETPYYWGGRSGFGIDCSGLVQAALAAVGIKAERDTEQQEKTVGKAADKAQAGDLVYFKGHVGIMVDETNILHANATHMKTCIEPLTLVAARSGGITAIRRI